MTADPVADVARAVLDGTAVDWSAAESDANPDRLRVIRQLQTIDRLAAVHRLEPTDLTARTWGHLQVLEPLGRGTFGTVFRAWDPRLDRAVALKLLPAPCGTSGAPPAIIEEGRLLARVRHPNVVTVYGAEQIGGRIGLWMELVSGRTLEEILRDSVFDPKEAVAIGIEICRAVAAVHAAGLLHRDIKTYNVTKADDGRVVLMDFGTGRSADDTSGSDLTGTPLYLAPEVFRGEPATVQSDLYSLGILIYRLLTRSYPVRAQTLADVRLAHEEGRYVRLQAARPDVPTRLAAIVNRATHPDTSKRYPSADALATDLTALTRGSRWRRFAAAGAAAAVLAAGGWTLWAVADREGPAPAPAEPAATALRRLAILPFHAADSGVDDAAMVTGVSDGVRRRLSSASNLVVIADDSSSRFPAGVSSRQAGVALGADVALDGTVSRSTGSFQVDARLTRLADGVVVWRKTFAHDESRPFDMPDVIAAAVAGHLGLRLAAQRRDPAGIGTWLAFQQAKAVQKTRSRDNLLRAAVLFDRIADTDPSYAPAFAMSALSRIHADRLRRGDRPHVSDARVSAAVRQALSLDDSLAEAWLAHGSLLAYELMWDKAEQAFLRALVLERGDTIGETEYVLAILLPLGRHADAIRYLEEARTRDPYSLDLPRVLAHVQIEAGHYDEAIETSRWILEREPEYPWAKAWLGRALTLSGNPAEAIRVLAGTEGLDGYIGYAHAVLGNVEEARVLAGRLAGEPSSLMLVHAGLGDVEGAFAALNRLVRVNPWRAATWMARPEMALLRADPRYIAIRRALGLLH